MKLFQYAVILHPTEEERKAGGVSIIVIPVTAVLARDQQGAILEAARDIPEEYMDRKDRLEVAVRPF